MTLREEIKYQIKKIDNSKSSAKYRVTEEAQKSSMKRTLNWVLKLLDEHNISKEKKIYKLKKEK